MNRFLADFSCALTRKRLAAACAVGIPTAERVVGTDERSASLPRLQGFLRQTVDPNSLGSLRFRLVRFRQPSAYLLWVRAKSAEESPVTSRLRSSSPKTCSSSVKTWCSRSRRRAPVSIVAEIRFVDRRFSDPGWLLSDHHETDWSNEGVISKASCAEGPQWGRPAELDC
jgi:hypothetical protein